MKFKFPIYILLFFALVSCHKKQSVDLIVHHAVVYMVDQEFNTSEAFAVKDGKFIAIGTSKEILDQYSATKMVDAGGKPVYPGLIDAHCHFYYYGKNQFEADLVGSQSFKEMIDRLVAYAKNNKSKWIMGRGWDQNLWAGKEFPVKDTLDILFPNTPVYLSRIDGHAALVNQKALDLAGITADTKIDGGSFVKTTKAVKKETNGNIKFGGINEGPAGRLTGVLVDNAAEKVKEAIPQPTVEEMKRFLLKAQENCFKVGLTTVDDAGLDKNIIDLIDAMQKSGELKMRVYAMASATKENLDYYLAHGPYKTDRLHVCSFKFYADGALGSRGACLLSPYADKPAEQGFLLSKPEYFREMAAKISASKFQMNTHCIGDSANRFMLDLYGSVLGEDNIRRWRIEHCQIVNQADFAKFGKYHILPSVQPTHATSDMYWAKDRIGGERLKGGYAYRQLLEQNGVLPTGSDFPVESINPLFGFYAAVARQDSVGFPQGGFQVENALSRKEALQGMTIWAAYSNFEETEKGSIERGKLADYVILDKDIMKIPLNEIRKVKVVGGSAFQP